MPTNHPWKPNNRAFSCPPDCPKRTPGCHSYCETHIREKAEYERKRAAMKLAKHIDNYSLGAIMDKRDSAAKRSKASGYIKQRIE